MVRGLGYVPATALDLVAPGVSATIAVSGSQLLARVVSGTVSDRAPVVPLNVPTH
jgi:hypothetical protein